MRLPPNTERKKRIELLKAFATFANSKEGIMIVDAMREQLEAETRSSRTTYGQEHYGSMGRQSELQEFIDLTDTANEQMRRLG